MAYILQEKQQGIKPKLKTKRKKNSKFETASNCWINNPKINKWIIKNPKDLKELMKKQKAFKVIRKKN